MARKMIKIVALVLMAVLTVATLSQTVLATENGGYNINQFTNTDTSGAASSISSIIGAIINIVQIIGTGVAIIMLIVIAIKYISAAPGDKADIKKHAVVYVVGAIVLFAASAILGIIQKFSTNIKAEGGNG